jgi:hypothetical protein
LQSILHTHWFTMGISAHMFSTLRGTVQTACVVVTVVYDGCSCIYYKVI